MIKITQWHNVIEIRSMFSLYKIVDWHQWNFNKLICIRPEKKLNEQHREKEREREREREGDDL